ncbi:MAG: S-layer homology domain-containing protein [Oscillospiraceae bacterium]|nr:S-layer homology domain-containing protein [Oscillospiraceae bacterium]
MKKELLAALLALSMTMTMAPAALAAGGEADDSTTGIVDPVETPDADEDGADQDDGGDNDSGDVTPPDETVNPSKAATYYVHVPSVTGGEIIPSTRNAAEDSRVTLSVHPEDGYTCKSLEVTDIRGRVISTRETDSSTFSFTMPAARVTVTAEFEQQAPAALPDSDSEVFTGLGTPGVSGIVLNPSPMPFLDVQGGDWYYSSVEYVWKHYLMSGVSDTMFDPDAAISRAMVWTLLARMNNVRTDVNPGATWYERGMVWAVEHGVTDGSDPLGVITREDLAVMLWRNAGAPGGSNMDMSRFSDFSSVSSYAQTAVRWAVGRGIMNGSGGKLNPQGTATRASVAAMIARYTG